MGAVFMTARAATLLALPWPLKYIIDNVIMQNPVAGPLSGILPDPLGHRMALLNILGLLTLGLGLLDALLVYLGSRSFLDAGQRIVFAIRFDLFSHVQRLSLAFHQRQRKGEVMVRLSGDTRQLQDFLAAIGIDLLPHTLTIIGMAVVMLVIDWRYALIALSVTPILFVIVRYYARRLRGSLGLVRNHEGTLSGVTQEILGNVHVVQAFARAAHEDARFGLFADASLQASLRANEVQAQFAPAMNLAIAVATGAIAWYGAVAVIGGHLTAGELLIFLAYLRGIATPVRQLAKSGRIFGRAMVALDRIAEYRAETPSITDAPHAITPATCRGEVVFEGVDFGYNAANQVLHDISFTLAPGRTVALVGATGSGKTSISNLVPRFYDPTRGRITLDGHDVRDLPLEWLRRQIGLVLQEPVLFQATIWENIAYARAGAGRAEAMEAAKAVGVDDIFTALPDGFDTMVSERGQSLSGGQRQCVAVARAMLCNAPVVILDEPSSSLDASTEQRLMQALATLGRQRAALIIAHRLSTVMQADLILVLAHGRIVERGTHTDLLALNGTYATLWRAHHNHHGALPRLLRIK